MKDAIQHLLGEIRNRLPVNSQHLVDELANEIPQIEILNYVKRASLIECVNTCILKDEPMPDVTIDYQCWTIKLRAPVVVSYTGDMSYPPRRKELTGVTVVRELH